MSAHLYQMYDFFFFIFKHCALTLTGLEGTYMSLSGKELEGHICPTIVTSWLRHLGRHGLGGAKQILHCSQGGMSS